MGDHGWYLSEREARREEDTEAAIKAAYDRNVKFVRLWFTDVLGFLKSFAITVENLESAIENGRGFDGSSIQGFARIDESDMIAMPDPSTFAILPWRGSETPVGRMFCDVQHPDGRPYEFDPRYVLKKNLRRAEEKGMICYVGPELEYFYFREPKHPVETLDEGGYFDLTPLDVASDLRRDTVLTLQEMGVKVDYSHHEVAPSQHEIDLDYTDALTMADQAMTYRLVVKEVALQHDVYATFMPKPLADENGSGMHVHMSLFKGDENVFFDADDECGLSTDCKHFISGMLEHAREITMVTNQWVNSYKRLVPGYEAPVYLSWALRNRSDLIRIPGYEPGNPRATRIEYRAPDPACNPYLAFAAMLAAGLEGMENEYEPRPPVEANCYEMTPEERSQRRIGSLPASLGEAITHAERSDVLRRALGEELHDKLLENKRIEVDRYRLQVTSWELDEY
ncbi:MAG: glutamine synthetase, partial [Armatimonadia bacterium]|nr:glutamine synthetase [Armatimonadia bacterium]